MLASRIATISAGQWKWSWGIGNVSGMKIFAAQRKRTLKVICFLFLAANLQNESFTWWLRIDRIGVARCLWSPYECIVVGDCVDDKKCERMLQHICSIVQREIRTHDTIPDGHLDDIGVRIPRTYHLHKRIFESNRTKLLQSIDGKRLNSVSFRCN